MRIRIARLVSAGLNPFSLGLIAILVLSFESSPKVSEALRWAAIIASVSLLPIFLSVIYLTRSGRMAGVLAASRRQRTAIYALSVAWAAAGYAVLHFSGAPALLRAAFAGGLGGGLVFAAINLVWKISLHVAFSAALVTLSIVLYGTAAVATIAAVLLVAWARMELRQHSLPQVVAGALLASLVVAIVLSLQGPA